MAFLQADGSDARFSGVRRQSLSGQVETALEDLIVYGVLTPGERLPEEQLAERLGVSRQPVREALHTLSRVGFVDVIPGRGAYVHVPTAREARDVYHVRALLEADSCMRAAMHASPEDLERLEAIYEAGVKLVRASGEPREFIDLNSDFHDAIMEIDPNEVSIAFMRDLRRRIAWYLVTIIKDRAPSSWDEHRRILDAIASGEPESARAAMFEHVNQSLELMNFADL